ncbi:MAG: CDGSH iron-sulfur domain-containing protein [Arenicellales bacterium]
MSDKKIFDYPGEQVDVHWDGRLCIHIAECGHAEGDLFTTGRQPWCVPDKATADEVAEVCGRCPSGALTYSDKSGKSEQADEENTVNVIYNGPLYLSGELAIEGAADDMTGVAFRAALCRCGQSKNKPFCDNSHHEAGFKDFGAVGETGPGLEAGGGTLKVKPLPDGPLLLSGNLSMVSGSGRLAWQGDSVALCRCGESKKKPFCDGSHKAAGFRSD